MSKTQSRMLMFNATFAYSMAVRLCLLKLEESSRPPAIVIVPRSHVEWPEFSGLVLVANPWLQIPQVASASNENSMIICLVATEAEFRFILTLAPLRFAEKLFILQLGPLPDKELLLQKSGFRGCVQFLEVRAESFTCPPLECVRASYLRRKEVRLPGYNWPPKFDVSHLSYQEGDLIPVEKVRGMLGQYHKTVGEQLGVKIVYQMVSVLNCTASFDLSIILKLLKGELDLLYLPLNSYLAFGKAQQLVSHTNYLHISNMAWAVPRAKPKSAFLNLILPLQRSAWISVLLVLVLAWVVGRISAGLSTSRAMLDAVSTLLGVSSSSLQSAPRFAVLGLRLSCLILTAVYQTKLASILTVPVFETQLETPREVIDAAANLKLFKPCYNQLVLVDDEKRQQDLDRQMHRVSNLSEALAVVALGRAALLSAQIPLQHAVKSSTYFRDTVLVQSEVVSMNPIGFFMRRTDSMLQRKINRIVSNVKAAGLLYKWDTSVSPKGGGQRRGVEGFKVKLTLTHLAGAFVLLEVGLFAAAAVFLLEVYVCPKFCKF